MQAHAGLDPAWMKEKCQAACFGIPQSSFRFKKGLFDWVIALIDEPYVIKNAGPRHRTRKIDVNAQEVRWNDIGRRIDFRHKSALVNGGGRSSKTVDHRILVRCQLAEIENDAIVTTRKQWESRSEG